MGWIQKNDGRVCSEGYSIEFNALINRELAFLQKISTKPILIRPEDKPAAAAAIKLESARYIHFVNLPHDGYKRAHITCRGAIFLTELERNNALGLD